MIVGATQDYAVCIKNGFMNNSERQFCIKGKIYSYRLLHGYEGQYPYDVKTEGKHKCSHSMSIDFFHEYFRRVTDTNFISKEEMEL